MTALSLTLLDQTFTIHRFSPDNEIPDNAIQCPFFAVMRTDEELSIVAPESIDIQSDMSDTDWACFKVDGPLEFDQVGILAGLASTLAEAKVSIFALSTFNTDYILVKQNQVEVTKEALKSAGNIVRS